MMYALSACHHKEDPLLTKANAVIIGYGMRDSCNQGRLLIKMNPPPRFIPDLCVKDTTTPELYQIISLPVGFNVSSSSLPMYVHVDQYSINSINKSFCVRPIDIQAMTHLYNDVRDSIGKGIISCYIDTADKKTIHNLWISKALNQTPVKTKTAAKVIVDTFSYADKKLRIVSRHYLAANVKDSLDIIMSMTKADRPFHYKFDSLNIMKLKLVGSTIQYSNISGELTITAVDSIRKTISGVFKGSLNPPTVTGGTLNIYRGVFYKIPFQ